MSFPIKLIDNNLIFNTSGECYAYYELEAYNYGFLSDDAKNTIFESLRQLIAQSRGGKLQLLTIATEESIRQTQEESKKHIKKGALEEIAIQHVDQVTEELIKTHGENELEYRYFLGFKLTLNEEQKRITKENFLSETKAAFKTFLASAQKNVLGDFVSIDKDEIERYAKVERLLKSKISKRFKVERMQAKDAAYIIKHLYGQRGVDYEKYEFNLYTDESAPNKKTVKYHDIINLTDSFVTENHKHLSIVHRDKEEHATYLCISNITGDLGFPDAEIIYMQQKQFTFPIDISINLECMDNKKALSTVRNKKKELGNLDEHAAENGGESSNNLLYAREDANELEEKLEATKEDMYKLSYVIRVTASDEEELQKRVNDVRDYYDDYGIKIERPYGDQLGLHEEFIPTSDRYMNDYIQFVTADFVASLGFGSAQKLGEKDGYYIGYNVETGKTVRIRPELAAQGVKGSITNALASAFIGSLGGGKSFANNLVIYNAVLFGAKVLLIDPKSERHNWKEDLVFIKNQVNIVNLTSEEKNKGLLDPFVIMDNRKDAERLAIDVLSFLTGINTRDGVRFPIIKKAIREVAKREKPGLLYILEELENMDDEEAEKIASHIESFTDYDFAHLLFSKGDVTETIQFNQPMNVLQIADLVLPDSETKLEEYTTIEMLSVVMMIVISTFALRFIQQDRSIFKIVDLDEAWAILQVAQGKTLANKLIRAGRAMNAADYFITQNTDDLLDEKMKNNIGMKFAFRSTDLTEIEKTFKFFNLEMTDENVAKIKNLSNGECMFQDIRGRTGVVKFDAVFEDLFKAFDTRPPQSTNNLE
ncbi:ATP-binding protein [Listeria ilorinensis]|uniref:conjugal transfer ATPase TcpF n=1 Tax=Listeria ilorinensis TaxID=2867439 RepID=UPI001EF61BDA|nr:ATP-binding protein [Listeria ilorinensis]